MIIILQNLLQLFKFIFMMFFFQFHCFYLLTQFFAFGIENNCFSFSLLYFLMNQ